MFFFTYTICGMCTPLHSSPPVSHSSFRAIVYDIQYSLARRASSFSDILDGIDLLLGIYATQYALSENALISLTTERRILDNTSYLWQEVRVSTSSTDEFKALLTALKALSSRITIEQRETSASLFIDGIATHHIIFYLIQQKHTTPYLTIIIDDVGENYALLKAFTRLPIELTFAVWPFASATQSSVAHLQSLHHAPLIHFPMEPFGYPDINPGKGAITTDMTSLEIEEHVRRALLAIPNASGINNHMGSLFTTTSTYVTYFINAITKLNPTLYIVDSFTHPNSLLYSTAQRAQLTAFVRSIFIDNVRTVEDTIQQLYKAQHIAQKYGHAIAIGHLVPTTLEALKDFIQHKQRNITIISLDTYVKKHYK